MKNMNEPLNEAVILTTDIHRYSRITANMTAEEIRDFMIHYLTTLQQLVKHGEYSADEFEPFAGDASIAIFRQKAGQDPREKCRNALRVALSIARAADAGKIPFTRMGIYAGEITEAEFNETTLRFGNCFAAATRLEQLCAYFGNTILMDRTIAMSQDEESPYIVAVGKVTPKNFEHPVHIFTIYKPGIHRCPESVDHSRLIDFIRLKNEGIEYFIGNEKKGIKSNFQLAENKLREASTRFKGTTGQLDIATLRILDYIHENPYPADTFKVTGIAMDEKQGQGIGIRLLLLSQQLLKAFDHDFYYALIENTDWEVLFRIEWFDAGDIIIRYGDEPNGIYYLARGKVRVQSSAGRFIAELAEGDIFGEMAYFSPDGKRSATVVAITDIAVRRISTEDFKKTSILHNLFSEIARRRLRPV